MAHNPLSDDALAATHADGVQERLLDSPDHGLAMSAPAPSRPDRPMPRRLRRSRQVPRRMGRPCLVRPCEVYAATTIQWPRSTSWPDTRPCSRIAPGQRALRAGSRGSAGLGRRDEALTRLDGMSLDNTPRSAERHVVRGELRARAQRWREAAADFDQAMASGRGTPAWQERALWGRAVARTHAGDQAGARADVQLYLQRYPTGRFASEAARLLATAR